MTIHSRKFFSETIPSGSASGSAGVSIGSIMRTAGYGFELDSDNDITTAPSMDSFNGTGLVVIPTSLLYFGQDQYVRDAAATGPPRLYKGVPAAAAEPFNVAEFCRGVVDLDEIYVYSPAGDQDLQIVFKGI